MSTTPDKPARKSLGGKAPRQSSLPQGTPRQSSLPRGGNSGAETTSVRKSTSPTRRKSAKLSDVKRMSMKSSPKATETISKPRKSIQRSQSRSKKQNTPKRDNSKSRKELESEMEEPSKATQMNDDDDYAVPLKRMRAGPRASMLSSLSASSKTSVPNLFFDVRDSNISTGSVDSVGRKSLASLRRTSDMRRAMNPWYTQLWSIRNILVTIIIPFLLIPIAVVDNFSPVSMSFGSTIIGDIMLYRCYFYDIRQHRTVCVFKHHWMFEYTHSSMLHSSIK